MLLRATLVVQCRRERLELDGSPSAEETLALAIQKLELEYKMRRLNEDGIVVLGDQTEIQLNRRGKQMDDMIWRAEECQEQLRRQRLSEEMQQAGSRKRAAAPASAGTAREKLQHLAREKLNQLARGKLH